MMEDTFKNNNNGSPVNPQDPGNTPNNDVPVNNGPASTNENQVIADPDHPEDLDVTWTRLKCLVCNYTYEGRNPIRKCPRCGNEDPEKFSHAD